MIVSRETLKKPIDNLLQWVYNKLSFLVEGLKMSKFFCEPIVLIYLIGMLPVLAMCLYSTFKK